MHLFLTFIGRGPVKGLVTFGRLRYAWVSMGIGRRESNQRHVAPSEWLASALYQSAIRPTKIRMPS